MLLQRYRVCTCDAEIMEGERYTTWGRETGFKLMDLSVGSKGLKNRGPVFPQAFIWKENGSAGLAVKPVLFMWLKARYLLAAIGTIHYDLHFDTLQIIHVFVKKGQGAPPGAPTPSRKPTRSDLVAANTLPISYAIVFKGFQTENRSNSMRTWEIIFMKREFYNLHWPIKEIA